MSSKRRRLSPEKIAEIRDAYNAWALEMYHPDSMTIDELADKLNVSKTSIYALKRSGWDPMSPRRPPGDRATMANIEAKLHDVTVELADVQLLARQLAQRVADLETRRNS